MKLWNDQKDDLLAGRKPRPKDDRATVGEAVNAFLDAKDTAVKAGELTARSWRDYKRAAAGMIKEFGRNRPLADLRPQDFAALKRKWAARYSLVTIGNAVQKVRVVLKWAYESGIIDTPIRTGPDFKRPSKKARRRAKQAAGPNMLSAEEVRAMIDNASSDAMRAMLLLGINCGLGNTDLATLPLRAVDLRTGWHFHGRPKTGTERRCPLWPETITALKVAIASRPKPKNPADEGLVFLTKYGRPFIRQPEHGEGTSAAWIDGVAQETKKILKKIGVKRAKVGFYTLRRTFQTVADESCDLAAVRLIMGHADSDDDMTATYRQKIADSRLANVAKCVHAWLFPPAKPADETRSIDPVSADEQKS